MPHSIVSDILLVFIVMVLVIAGSCIFAWLRTRRRTRPPEPQ